MRLTSWLLSEFPEFLPLEIIPSQPTKRCYPTELYFGVAARRSFWVRGISYVISTEASKPYRDAQQRNLLFASGLRFDDCYTEEIILGAK